MNTGDCFILDAGSDIYVYVGSQAKRVEKLKAISAANQIRDQDHNGRARVQIVDDFSTDADKQHFFDVLGSGSADQVPDESTADEDSAFERTDAAAVSLYKVSDASGKLKVDIIGQKPLTQAMLDTLKNVPQIKDKMDEISSGVNACKDIKGTNDCDTAFKVTMCLKEHKAIPGHH